MLGILSKAGMGISLEAERRLFRKSVLKTQIVYFHFLLLHRVCKVGQTNKFFYYYYYLELILSSCPCHFDFPLHSSSTPSIFQWKDQQAEMNQCKRGQGKEAQAGQLGRYA